MTVRENWVSGSGSVIDAFGVLGKPPPLSTKFLYRKGECTTRTDTRDHKVLSFAFLYNWFYSCNNFKV